MRKWWQVEILHKVQKVFIWFQFKGSDDSYTGVTDAKPSLCIHSPSIWGESVRTHRQHIIQSANFVSICPETLKVVSIDMNEAAETYLENFDPPAIHRCDMTTSYPLLWDPLVFVFIDARHIKNNDQINKLVPIPSDARIIFQLSKSIPERINTKEYTKTAIKRC